MSAGLTRYKAKADCRVGGFFRRAGEEFDLPTMKGVPDHLEELDEADDDDAGEGGEAAKAVKAPAAGTAKAKAAQVEKADIGAGVPTSAGDVNSADMIPQK